MRRYCACLQSTSSTRWPNESIFTQQQFFCSIFLTKIKLHSTSPDSSRLIQQGGQSARIFPRFLSSKKSGDKPSQRAASLKRNCQENGRLRSSLTCLDNLIHSTSVHRGRNAIEINGLKKEP